MFIFVDLNSLTVIVYIVKVMRIIDNTRPDRQTVMFSATFPRQMEALARRILNKPIEITVGGRSVVCADVEQHVLIIEDDQKFLKVRYVLLKIFGGSLFLLTPYSYLYFYV